MLLRLWAFLFVLAVCFPAKALSATVNLGLISFDVLVPGGDGSPGVNVFNISNLTGDPLSDGFALPPDFPVMSALTFENSGLVLFDFIIPIGDVAPGPGEPTDALSFPGLRTFPSATFIGRLNQTSFLLADGSSFTAASQSISATIRPSAGTTLVAGSDFALITVSDIPEPATAVLTGTAFLLLLAVLKRQNG